VARRQHTSRDRPVLARLARSFWLTIAGAILDAATVIVYVLDAVSDQQAIAMALPAGVLTAGGLIAMMVPDPWSAWRLGFRQGCETSAKPRRTLKRSRFQCHRR
jgi:uncharacterized membrane protein